MSPDTPQPQSGACIARDEALVREVAALLRGLAHGGPVGTSIRGGPNPSAVWIDPAAELLAAWVQDRDLAADAALVASTDQGYALGWRHGVKEQRDADVDFVQEYGGAQDVAVCGQALSSQPLITKEDPDA